MFDKEGHAFLKKQNQEHLFANEATLLIELQNCHAIA